MKKQICEQLSFNFTKTNIVAYLNSWPEAGLAQNSLKTTGFPLSFLGFNAIPGHSAPEMSPQPRELSGGEGMGLIEEVEAGTSWGVGSLTPPSKERVERDH